MGKLLIIRHGETLFNFQQILQGHCDSPLTEKGEKQARLLSARLKNDIIDEVYSSDLPRTRRTTELILDGRDLPVTFDARLRERNLGVFEMHTREEYAAVRGEIPREVYRPEGGESWGDVFSRIRAFLEEKNFTSADQITMIVAHAGSVRALLGVLMKITLREAIELEIQNCSLNVIEWSPGSEPCWTLQNSCEHLGGL